MGAMVSCRAGRIGFSSVEAIEMRHFGSFLLGALLLAIWPLAAEEQASVTISGGVGVVRAGTARPMLEALYALAVRFEWKIGFEEARIQYLGDMVDVTSPEYVPKSKDDRAYFPRGGPLEVKFAVSPRTGAPADAEAVVRQVIAEYEARGYPGRYGFHRADDGWMLVYPVEVRNSAGAWTRAEAFTLVPVRVEIGEREVLQHVLDGVLNQLGARCGCQAGFGGVAMNELFRPARGVLREGETGANRFFDGFGLMLGLGFWRLLWAPDMKFYVFAFAP